jgi:hypothetical protein
MTQHQSSFSDTRSLGERALSRWENEGGSEHHDHQNNVSTPKIPELTNAELMQLRVRVIGLENLIIALMSGASDGQLEAVREMAQFILPRPGFTQHPLTVNAADHMVDLVQRAERFGPTTKA